MKRQVRLGTFIATFTTAYDVAQAQSASVPVPPASKPSDPPTTDVLPGGNVTWLIIGLGIGFVAGYIVGRNSVRDVTAGR
ncbi:hypothetical protein [Piscinibacter sp. XHJ-5]|uniref:hypothetical protein n=1 Tax=Piscinibacter sp. XHJ-5 TaxID=3037797 RepID=UPI0024532B93|nr:hypothetical protein [Piscinibacter sp. XHJ-5]